METLLEAVKEWAKSDPGAVPKEIKAQLKLSSTFQDSESDGKCIDLLKLLSMCSYYYKEFDVCMCNGLHNLLVLE